jgi:hypothetical protein
VNSALQRARKAVEQRVPNPTQHFRPRGHRPVRHDTNVRHPMAIGADTGDRAAGLRLISGRSGQRATVILDRAVRPSSTTTSATREAPTASNGPSRATASAPSCGRTAASSLLVLRPRRGPVHRHRQLARPHGARARQEGWEQAPRT